MNLNFFSFSDLYESKIALKISKSNGWLLFDGSNGKVSLVELFIWEGFGDEGFQFEEWHDESLLLSQSKYCLYHNMGKSYNFIIFQMIKPNKSQKIIMYSKDVSSLPSSLSSKHLLPVI